MCPLGRRLGCAKPFWFLRSFPGYCGFPIARRTFLGRLIFSFFGFSYNLSKYFASH